MWNVVLDVVLDCTFGIIGVDVAHEPGGLVVAMTGDHVNVVWDIALGKTLLPVIPPLGGDVAWIIDVVSLHGLKKIVDGRVVIVVIDVVGSRIAIGVDDNDSRLFVGEPRPGIFGIGILTNGVIDTVFIGVYVVLADVTGVCRVGEIHE